MVLNLIASCIYFITLALCFRAVIAIRAPIQYWGKDAAVRFWIFAGVLFAVLIAMRLANIEDTVRNALREVLVAHGDYQMRRRIQGPLAVVAALVTITLGTIAWRTGGHANLRSTMTIRIARLALTAMIGLICLRIISLHVVDRLLFSGLHLNRLLDIGATVTTAWAAWTYPRYVVQELAAAQNARTRSRA